MEDIFWLRNPKVLISKWDEFIPNDNNNTMQNINSIVRFLLYCIILVFIYGSNSNVKMIFILLCIIINIIGILHDSDIIGDKIYDKINAKYFDNNIMKKDININYADNLQIKYYNDDILNEKDYHNNECRLSTIDNPLGNILITMSPKELSIPACDSNINTPKRINDNIITGLYLDSSDIFKKSINDIHIQNVSTTYPTNTDDFKKYLYDLNTNNCKINGKNCIGWTDIRYYK